jgi:hypothetical protein
MTAFGRFLPFATVSYGSVSTGRGRQKSADSVEKVGPPKLPAHWLVKTPFFARGYVKSESGSLCQK